MVTVIETLTAIEGKELELKQALIELSVAAREEKDIIHYHLFSKEDNPSIFMISMAFKSLEAKLNHDHSTHVQEFEKKYDQKLYSSFTEDLYVRVD